MTYSPSTPAAVFRYTNALVLVVFSIVMLAVHVGQVRVPHDVSAICTATNTPANCWKHGGFYRAVQFTAPTTSVAYQNFGAGTIYDPDGGTRAVGSLPYAVVFAGGKTEDHRQHWCEEQLAFPDDVERACKVEKIPELWEVPNRGLYRSAWTFAGGVHVWYFMWLATWIAASFAVVMLPPFVDYFKLPILVSWHLIGVVLSVMFFVDDYYFQLRMPLNNVFVGVVLEALAVLVQFYWGRQSQEEWDVDTLRSSAYQALPAGLAGLMTLGPNAKDGEPTPPPGPPGPRRTSYATRKGGSAGGAREQDGLEVWTLGFEVFNTKLERLELVEALFVEMAITVPPLLIAVFCMASRVNLDWVIASLYLRAVFIFASMAVCFKALKFAKAKAVTSSPGQKAELWLVMFIFAVTLTYLAVFFILDWYTPVKDTVVLWGDAYDTSVSAVIYFALVAVSLVLLAFLLLLLLVVYTVSISKGDMDYKEGISNLQVFFFYGAQFGLLVFRTVLFTYAVDPRLWYDNWDRQDVPLNYPL